MCYDVVTESTFYVFSHDQQRITFLPVTTGGLAVLLICGFITFDIAFAGGRIYNSRCTLVVAGNPKKASDDVVPFKGYMDQVGQHYVSYLFPAQLSTRAATVKLKA